MIHFHDIHIYYMYLRGKQMFLNLKAFQANMTTARFTMKTVRDAICTMVRKRYVFHVISENSFLLPYNN